jgi:hypothetical protein
LGAGALSGVSSLLGAHEQAKGAKGAANLQMDQFNTLNQQQQPFIKAGYGANQQLAQLLGIGGTPGGTAAPGKPLSYEDWTAQNNSSTSGILSRLGGDKSTRSGYDQYLQGFQPGTAPDSTASDYGSLLHPFDADTFRQYQDPGYQFRLQQGQQGVLNSAAAGSGALSGAALKDLLSFNQDLASTEYSNAFNRYQTQQGNIFQRLSSLANLGQNAAANVGQQGTALATGAGQSLTNAGTATGAGIVGAGNALGNSLSNYWLMGTDQGRATLGSILGRQP